MSTSWIKMKALFFRSKSNIKDSRSKYKFTTITDTFIRTRHFKKSEEEDTLLQLMFYNFLGFTWTAIRCFQGEGLILHVNVITFYEHI